MRRDRHEFNKELYDVKFYDIFDAVLRLRLFELCLNGAGAINPVVFPVRGYSGIPD